MVRLVNLIVINSLLACLLASCSTETHEPHGSAAEPPARRSHEDGPQAPTEQISTDAETYFKLGLKYQTEEGSDEESVANFSKAIDLDPAYALAYSNRGFVYMTAFKNRVKACSDFRRACELEECGNYNTALEAGHCVFRLSEEPEAATVEGDPPPPLVGGPLPKDFTGEYTEFSVTYVDAEAEGEYDRKKDIVVPTSNPDALHVLRMSSPSFTGCMRCSTLYDTCFGEHAALEGQFEACKSRWQFCVVEQKANCRMLIR